MLQYMKQGMGWHEMCSADSIGHIEQWWLFDRPAVLKSIPPSLLDKAFVCIHYVFLLQEESLGEDKTVECRLYVIYVTLWWNI